MGPLLFIIHMNDLPSCVTISKLYYSLTTPRFIILFVVLEIFHCFKMIQTQQLCGVRHIIMFLVQKRVSTYINAKVITNYKIADTQVLTSSPHKNLGIIISSDLSWDQHYKNIIPKTYRMLGLLHCSFSKHQIVTAKRNLYISLVRSQVIYCSNLTISRLYLVNMMLRIIMKFCLSIII